VIIDVTVLDLIQRQYARLGWRPPCDVLIERRTFKGEELVL
jgi:hypothetical protein